MAKHGAPIDIDVDHPDWHKLWLLRSHLYHEEGSEISEAAWRRDMPALLDGLGDALYITLGMFAMLGIDPTEVFNEIHRSNMTKQVTDDIRVSTKGPDYRPPDMLQFLGARHGQ